MGVCRTPKKGDVIKVQPLSLNVKIFKNCISDRIPNLRLPVYDSIIALKCNAAIVAHVLLFNENVLTSRIFSCANGRMPVSEKTIRLTTLDHWTTGARSRSTRQGTCWPVHALVHMGPRHLSKVATQVDTESAPARLQSSHTARH